MAIGRRSRNSRNHQNKNVLKTSKAKLNVPVDASKDELLTFAKADEKVQAATDGMNIIKEIVVPKKLVNIVVKP